MSVAIMAAEIAMAAKIVNGGKYHKAFSKALCFLTCVMALGIPQFVFAQELATRGLVRSLSRINIKAEVQAPVAKTPFREGDQFSKGDILLSFNCDRYNAEMAAAKAVADRAFVDHKSKKRLLAHQAIGRDEVSLAAAEASKAAAELEVQKVINSGCQIVAPFNGRLVELNARPNELPTAERPLMVILDDKALEVELVVPSNWLGWLKPGVGFDFAIDETGDLHAAKVDRLGAEIDPVSQTVKVFATLAPSGSTVLSGMSGLATFKGGS